MTTPLRLAAVVTGLLVTGFTAEHFAFGEQDAAPSLEVWAPTVSDSAPTDSVTVSALSMEPISLGTRLPMGPVQGPVSSPFGPRVHPVSGRVRHHDGVDLAVPAGTAVWTVAAGVVRAVGRRRGYGLVVEMDHPAGLAPDGQGEPVRTRYAHLASVDSALRPGTRVGRGMALGASGGVPGRDGVSTGAHLHFEVRDVSGRPLDPARFVRLPESASTAPRWTGPKAPGRGAEPLPSPRPEPPAAGAPEPDSLDADAGLPPLVLPDYPSFSTPTGTP